MKENFKLVMLAVISFSLVAIIEIVKPKPLDWSPGFSVTEKKPFGSYVLYSLMEDLFPRDSIFINHESLYRVFSKNSVKRFGSYINIESYFSPDSLETDRLLKYVKNGGNAFIASNHFGKILNDSLKFKETFSFFSTDSVSLSMRVSDLKNKKYTIKNNINFTFKQIDSSTTYPLGYDSAGHVNFIRVTFGSGKFYLHTVPLIFTNYNLLKDNNYQYIQRALSFLPYKSVLWDEHNKNGGYRKGNSPIRYLLSEDSLRWAYFLTLAGLFIFIFVEGKRKQRIVPVIKQLTNDTLNFVDTIGRLYLQNQNHTDLALKKRLYLMEFIRTNYRLDTSQYNDSLVSVLNKKTGIDPGFLKKLFDQVFKIHNKSQIDKDQLKRLNKMIEKFYNKCKGISDG